MSSNSKRPTVITGGELKLDMLELKYNSVARTYQAPLQFKAMGGVFIVDDNDQITLWRDYFDMTSYLNQLERLASG